jgi:E3 ubiquitin-protein ligase RBBP6
MSIHYKFKNTINYDAVKFDGVYISAADLKSIIVQQKKLGHSELQVMNEETGTVYADHENIPKNTNIIVSRIPFANSNKRARLAANNHHHSQDKHGSGSGSGNVNGAGLGAGSGSGSGGGAGGGIGNIGSGGGREAMELVSTKDMSEEEKIKYIQSQSTKDFDPTRYARGGGRGGHRGGRGGHHRHFVPGPGYTCRKCGIPGHSIYDCKMSHMMKVKRSTGIPRDFLEKADSKEKGAVLTPSGEYAVHYLDREAYNNPKVEKPPFFEDGSPPPSSDTTTSTQASSTKTLAIASNSEPTSRAKRKHNDDH